MKKFEPLNWAVLLILLSLQISAKAGDMKEGLNVATFNLRMDTPADGVNAWPNRKEMVKALIRFHDFDIFGTQEGFSNQLEDISGLDNYAYIGVGRDDGKKAGEHSAIFYKKNRFRVLEQGNFWYSSTPDLPGKGWDATCCNRICSWGKFKDLISNKVFYFFNSHFDHQGVVARRESAHLLLRKIVAIAGTDHMVIATGDFNAKPDDEPIVILSDSGILFDAYTITEQPPYGTIGTFNSFNPNSPMTDRIDYIWVSKGVRVCSYAVFNDMQYGRFPSDHFPVGVRIAYY